jgi:UrcA family protein
MNLLASLSALLCLGLCQPLSAMARAPQDTGAPARSIIVSTADLKLERQQDRHVLHWRLQGAAEQLCGSTNGLGMGQALPVIACQRRVLASANRRAAALIAASESHETPPAA